MSISNSLSAFQLVFITGQIVCWCFVGSNCFLHKPGTHELNKFSSGLASRFADVQWDKKGLRDLQSALTVKSNVFHESSHYLKGEEMF